MIHTKQLIFTIVFIAASTILRCSFGSQIDYHVKNSDFEVRCLGHTGSLVMSVVCYKNAWANFPIINLDQTIAGKITFVNCSFPETLILKDTLHSFNFTNYKAIKFVRARSSLYRRNFQSLKVSRLEFTKGNSSKLPFDMLYNISSLRELLIERNNVVRIPEEFFKDWAKFIKKIDLNKNQLQKVAKNDFARLNSLKNIDLSNNKIAEIEVGAFDDLISLKVLNLNNNQLRTLPSGIFHHLSKLKIIYLNKNSFDELPHDLLSGIQNANLQSFFMNGITGSLRKLPSSFFKNLTALNVIALENSNLEILPVDVFGGTLELSVLMFGNNILKNLPYGLFNYTKKLLDLDLSNNHLKNLPTRMFENLNSLEYLDISHNYLESLKTDVLQGLYLLKELNVSHNNLTQIDYQLFTSLKSAIAIDLSFNRITSDSQSTHFSSLRNASIFIKSSNKTSKEISDYPDNRGLNDDMKNIDLRYNNFTELTAESIRKLNCGGLVDFRNNHISKINLTGLPFQLYLGSEFNTTFKTMKLLLSNNPLNCNCHFTNAVHYLNVESAAQKFVKFIINKQSGGTLACASRVELEEYYGVHEIRPNVNCLLKYNEHKDACPDTCICKKYPEKHVVSVDCSHKHLTKLPALIRNPHGWAIKLNMSHNLLAQTPSLNESYLVDVTSLDLSYNNISSVELGVFSSSLKDLKLHNNRISRLDSDIIEYLTNAHVVHSITLHGNKWSCDCQALQFLSFVQEKLTRYKLRKIACHGTNRKLYKMTVHKMCKSTDAAINDSSLIMIILFGIIVGSLAAILIYYNCRKRIKVWLYSERWRLQVYARNKKKIRKNSVMRLLILGEGTPSTLESI